VSAEGARGWGERKMPDFWWFARFARVWVGVGGLVGVWGGVGGGGWICGGLWGCGWVCPC